MGFVRGSLLVIISVMLFISLLGVHSLFIVSSSLSYENVNDQIKSIVYEGELLKELFPESSMLEEFGVSSDNLNLTEEQEEAVKSYAEEECLNKEEFSFNYGEYTVSIPCEEIQNDSIDPSRITQTIINETIDDFVNETYYEDYDCNYWDCFTTQGTPLFLLSEKSKDYWQGKMTLMFFISLILIVLMFFLVEQKQNFPIVLGGVLIMSALPLWGIESFILAVFGSFAKFFTAILTNIKSMFWFSLVFGLILIGVGIAWRIWAPDSLKKKFSKKDIKKLSKKK